MLNAVMLVVVVIGILIQVAWLALNAYFLNYVDRLKADGCQCALGWRRDFVQAVLIFIVIMSVVQLLGMAMGWRPYTLGAHGALYMVLSLLLLAVMVAYIIVTRQFLSELSHDSCQCAKGTAYSVLNVFNWIQVIALGVYALVVVLALIAMTIGVSRARGSPAGGSVRTRGASAVARRR